jgi:hypothetical protein
MYDKAGSGAQPFHYKVDSNIHSKHHVNFNNNFLFLVYLKVIQRSRTNQEICYAVLLP